MASDNLNQVGKYIRNTKEDVDWAIKRDHRRRARIERIRDTFTPATPFVMYFRVEEGEEVQMDLNFFKPPPGKGSGGGGDAGGGTVYSATCESFTIGIDPQILQTSNPYEPGTVTVYMNGTEVPVGNWSEYDPTNNEVYIAGGLMCVNTIAICYIFAVGV